MLQANQQVVSGRGTMTTVANPESGQSARVFVPNLPEGTPLAKAAATLNVALEGFAGNVRVAAATLLPIAIAEHLRTAARNVLARPFAALQKEAITFRQTNDKAMALAMSVVPATVATAPIRARAVKAFDEADIAGKARAIQSFTFEQMSGVVEVGALDQLPDDLATVAKDRFMIMAHIARTGLQANYQKVPSARDVLASGADVDAAMAAAQEGLDALKAKSTTVADAAQVLNDVMLVVGLACELSTDAAYALLTGNPTN